MTTRSAIRKECGVKRFNVANTIETLEGIYTILRARKVPPKDALMIIGFTYRCGIRESTTKNH